MSRSAKIQRETKETRISIELDLDGTGRRDLQTPIPFFTHMLDAFAKHGLFDLTLHAEGDIEIDGHHTIEDTGLALGDAFKEALGERAGIYRFGQAKTPMDETLAEAVIDFSGRPALVYRVDGIQGKWVGSFDCDLVREFFQAYVSRAGCNLHLLIHHGRNAHHIVEALFKSFARASRAAVEIDPRRGGEVPSTKGTLSA